MLKHRFAHKHTDLTQQAWSGVQHYIEAPDDTVSQIPMKHSCRPKCEINMGEYKLRKLPEGRQAHRGRGGSSCLMANVFAFSLHRILALGRGRRGSPFCQCPMGQMGTPWGSLEEACAEEPLDTGMGPWNPLPLVR